MRSCVHGIIDNLMGALAKHDQRRHVAKIRLTQYTLVWQVIRRSSTKLNLQAGIVK